MDKLFYQDFDPFNDYKLFFNRFSFAQLRIAREDIFERVNASLEELKCILAAGLCSTF